MSGQILLVGCQATLEPDASLQVRAAEGGTTEIVAYGQLTVDAGAVVNAVNIVGAGGIDGQNTFAIRHPSRRSSHSRQQLSRQQRSKPCPIQLVHRSAEAFSPTVVGGLLPKRVAESSGPRPAKEG